MKYHICTIYVEAAKAKDNDILVELQKKSKKKKSNSEVIHKIALHH